MTRLERLALGGAAALGLVVGETGAAAQDAGSIEARAAPTGVVEAGPSSVMSSRRFVFPARAVDQTYLIDVAAIVSPVAPPQPGRKLPVVFVVDGNVNFPMVASTASILSLGELPSMVVVGVGYELDPSLGPGEGLLAFMASRNRDLTPTRDEAWLAQMSSGMEQATGASYPSFGAPGGADAFLSFIDDELKPFIAEQYPEADLEDTAVLGHSLGGLFVLHALFTSPESFDRYVAGSPSLWWRGGMMLDAAAALGDADARLFMSFGALEPAEQMLEPGAEMDALLSGGDRPSLRYTFHVFDGETHESVIPATFSRGLRAVFDPPAPPAGAGP